MTDMKLRSTTPASISRVSKGILISVISVLFVIATIPLAQPAAADQYDDKIAVLTADMARYQSEADRLNGEATTLANAVAQLNNEKNALQSQIDLNQAQSDKLVIDIASTKAQIKDNQDALGKTIADLYISDDTSPIEMLASSTNIGDFLNKQEYRTSVKTELNSTIIKVKTLKTQLDTQKTDLDKVLAAQTSARDSLVVKQNEQQSLLSQTQNDEANYQGLIKSNASQIAAAKATQAAIRARSNATGGYTLVDAGSLSDYPWSDANCRMSGYMSTGGADGNGGDGHGYGCRQCVSFVAWRIAKATGVYYNDLGNGGSAGYNLVHKHGYTDLGRSPQPGSVAVLWGTSSAPYSNNSNPGHVAYVEGVSADGTKVTVSQYNYNYGSGWGMYSEMVLSTSFFDQYVQP